MSKANESEVTAAKKRTPRHWAQFKGHEASPPKFSWQLPVRNATYAAAAALHGWDAHEHHFQAPGSELLISEADYDAAILAGADYPAVPAHGPALSPIAKGRDLKGRGFSRERQKAAEEVK